jgi:hypothetical protein
MKIAVLLTGISYKKDGYRDRDWKLTYENIQNNVINCWLGYNVNVYLTTYDNNDNTELLESYNPKKYGILKYEESDQRLTYVKSLEMLLDEDVDFIVSTRFDIHFKEKLSNIAIKFDKFNFLFKEREWDNINFVTDNLFMFPKTYLNDLMMAIKNEYENPKRIGCSDLHNIYNRLIHLDSNLNIISDINELSDENSFYKLIRI